MSDATIKFADGSTEVLTGEYKLHIRDETGVLTVTREDGSRTRISPAGWVRIDDEPKASSGQPEGFVL